MLEAVENQRTSLTEIADALERFQHMGIADQELIGQLYGGFSSCSDPSGIDNYGRFNATYNSIKQWIDPGGSGGPPDPTPPGAHRHESR